MGALWSLWWVWGVIALGLAIIEILLPGFVFLGFAIGAAAVAVILLTPLSLTLPVLLLVFAVLSDLIFFAIIPDVNFYLSSVLIIMATLIVAFSDRLGKFRATKQKVI